MPGTKNEVLAPHHSAGVERRMGSKMLEIKNLRVKIEDKEILKGLNLTVRPGEVHAIMGPNGSGKSTLSNVLAGREEYEVTGGEIWYQGRNLLEMEPEERAREGIFLAFQYPVEIRSEEHTSELQSRENLVCRLLLEKKK